jgi:hypothetical protein
MVSHIGVCTSLSGCYSTGWQKDIAFSVLVNAQDRSVLWSLLKVSVREFAPAPSLVYTDRAGR